MADLNPRETSILEQAVLLTSTKDSKQEIQLKLEADHEIRRELHALEILALSLKPLDEKARFRVLQWAASKFLPPDCHLC